MPTLPPIANLQAFEAVARRRSFALAAAELNLTASAISHQVSRLEAQLDIRLFERSAHGVRLSPAGEHYLMHVGAALNAIATATDDLRHGIWPDLEDDLARRRAALPDHDTGAIAASQPSL